MVLTELAIRRPIATAMFYLGVLLLGIISLSRLSVDLLPDLSYPQLTVRTTFPNASPVEVEELVTRRIEEVLATVPGIRQIESISREGISLVFLEFVWGTDMDIASLNVREKLDNVRWFLPREAGRPTILHVDPRSLPVMTIAVAGGDLVSLKELSANVFKRRLEQIDGVALATVVGGLEREIHVEVDQGRLEALGLDIGQVAGALQQANQAMPGGTIRKGRYRFSLRTLGEFQSIQDIEDVVLLQRKNGTRVLLRDVAVVRDGFRERNAITRYNGKEAIGIIVNKEAGANTVEVAGKIKNVLAQLREEYPEVDIAIASDQSRFIAQAISNVLQAVLYGGVLAFLVLFLFLHDLRNPVNIATSIPIAVLATFALMYFFGVNLNMISLGGLALGIGMLVDNSIVVLENIFRLRQEGMEWHEAGSQGAREVAMPITASTLTTIAVFFPIVYVRGVAGQLFRDQSFTVSFSLLASLLVALTLLPMLAVHLRRKEPGGRLLEEHKERPDVPEWAGRLPGILGKAVRVGFAFAAAGTAAVRRGLRSAGRAAVLQGSSVLGRLVSPVFSAFDRGFSRFAERYERTLGWALDHRGTVLAGVLAVFFLTTGVAMLMDRRLMPDIDEKQFTIQVTLPPGTALAVTGEEVARIEQDLLRRPEVASVFSQIGLASDQTAMLLEKMALYRARILVRLKPTAGPTRNFIQRLEEEFRGRFSAELIFETGETVLSQYLESRKADLEIKILGDDLQTSLQMLREIQARLQSVAGLADLQSSHEGGRPEIRLIIDRERVGLFGLTARQVARFIRDHFSGTVATQFKEFDRNIDILIRPFPQQRDELEDLLNAEIPTRKGRVRVGGLVRVQLAEGPVEILREGQVRKIALSGYVRGRDFKEVVREVNRVLAGVKRPLGYRIEVGGKQEEVRSSFRSLVFAFGLAVLLVYMILAAQFESLIQPAVVMTAVPLALIGAVLLLFVTGQSFNVMSLIGIVVLVGIVVNDAIVKVDFINQARRRGQPLRAAIEEAGRKRLRPIIMTTVTTVLGLAPMAVGLGSGAELRRPLAVAVIGGLTAATFLTLVVVPVLYSLVVREGSR
jgi:HAE1 family hydrophobic/amphiphilic exporter-1